MREHLQVDTRLLFTIYEKPKNNRIYGTEYTVWIWNYHFESITSGREKKLTIFQLFGMKQYFVGFTFHIAVV